MGIEADREATLSLPIDVEMLRSLRETARLAATHYSTQIEGNRLTHLQVQKTLAGARFPGRERDVKEVRNYYRAMKEVERLSQRPGPISEGDIRQIHGLVLEVRSFPSQYRDGQNVIRDSISGSIVYLIAWIDQELGRGDLPVPTIAALTHYQYATIHPYYDGNGRRARLLTTLLLHRTGYGLKGIYNLEEYYAGNLIGYYAALDAGTSHHYYFGRAEADVTDFIQYFCLWMRDSSAAVRAQAGEALRPGMSDHSELLRQLDPRQRQLLILFRAQGTAKTGEIAACLGLSQHTVVSLCRFWVIEGLLALHNPSRKNRLYQLGPRLEQLAVDSLPTATEPIHQPFALEWPSAE